MLGKPETGGASVRTSGLGPGGWLGESGEFRVTEDMGGGRVARTQAGPSTEAPVPFPRVDLSHKHLGWTCVWSWRSAVGCEGLLCLHLCEVRSVGKSASRA